MRRSQPGGKVLVLTLIAFVLCLTQLRNPDPWIIFWLTSIPAGWFMLNRLLESVLPESDGIVLFGPVGGMLILQLIVFAIKVIFKLGISMVIGPVALLYSIVVGVMDVLPKKKEVHEKI